MVRAYLCTGVILRAMQECDLIVSAAHLLPVAPQNIVLENHALAVSDGRIVACAPEADISSAYQARQHLSLPHHIVIPGLVNAHGHAAMTLLRGAGEDQTLEDWLNHTIWPLEGRLVNPDFVSLGTELAIAEMLRSGTTTFSDMYFFPEVVAKLAVELGVRVQVAFPVIEMANVWSSSVEEGLHKGLALHDEYRHHSQVQVAFGPHAAYSVSADNLQKVAMYANELETPIQIHLHETAVEVAQAKAQSGQSWVSQLHQIGFLAPHVQTVHMTQLTEQEISLVSDSGASVVHCPASNLKLASGYCPATQLTAQGVRVGLGTDGAASNNTLDMFKEMHLAALMAKHSHADPTRGNAPEMLYMATLGGAQAMSMADDIGSLEVGKFADFVALDSRNLTMQPLYDPFAALVHGNCGNAVDTVCVAGETLLQQGQLTRIDATDLAARVSQWHGEHIGA